MQLAESERYPLKLKPGEKRDITFTLMDCDGVADKGAGVEVETVTGEVTPSPVKVDGDGNGKFTYTAPRKDVAGQIRVAFIYRRGSEHPGTPEVDHIDVQVGVEKLTFRTVMDVKIHSAQMEHNETHHSEIVFGPAEVSGTNCTTSMQVGERCRLQSSSVNASATSQWPEGSHSASLTSGNTVAEIIRTPAGATLHFGYIFALTSPDEDDEHYIGVCNDQPWLPDHLDLTEKELENFSKLQKTVKISSPLGVNNCVGSGTMVLTGQH